MIAMFMPFTPACRSCAGGKRSFSPRFCFSTGGSSGNLRGLMRILIATITAGAGHVAAAAALEEAWLALRPDDTVERIDLIKFFSPLHKKFYADGYVQLVERAPELW